MSDNNTISDLDARHVWHPFTQAKGAMPPIPIKSAHGATLVAEDGREYLDLISSWWVNLHGHTNRVIADAVAEQARTLEQVIFADFTHAPAANLAARVTALLPGDLNRVFFSDDGSTAVEVAMKMAHQYWRNKGSTRPRFIAFEGGYHGDTFGAMSAGAASGFFDAFRTLLFPVISIPFPETWDGDDKVEEKEAKALAALDKAFDAHGPEIAAVIMEPLVQGAGGMRMCRAEFLRAVEDRVRTHANLLIFDEVMTGFGRTGAAFACIKAGVTPDLICLSKGLTGGFLPLSLTVATDEVHAAFLDDGIERAFLHGHSFTANPLGCAAGLASLDLLLSPEIQSRIQAIEAKHRERLGILADDLRVRRTRVTGTIGALNLKASDGAEAYGSSLHRDLKAFFLERGLLIRPLGSVIYLLPPYCITDEELDRAWDVITEAVQAFGAKLA